jgi:mono/diheme cytochrome c family protein
MALAFIGIWIAVGIAIVLIALGGGPRGARARLLDARSRPARRALGLVIAAIYLGLGIAIPAVVIAGNKDHDEAGNARIKLTASQEHGRELFGQICQQCHTLAEAGAVGKVGPNLDKLKPPKALVLDAVLKGRARGAGRMPAGLYQGKDAEDVADFVSKVAGRQ